MREVIFDTETTGLEPNNGDRIVEVGCVELVDLKPTGREFQIYVNPGRPVSEATVRITGITNDILRDKLPFSHPDVVDRLMEFLGDDPVVAHNAEFDRGFLNAELGRLGRPELPRERFIDTAAMARKHRPGSPASLDAVCKRFERQVCEAFGVKSLQEARPSHGALIDSRLLAVCYLELRGGRERSFDFAVATANRAGLVAAKPQTPRATPLPSRLSPDEAVAHAAFVAGLGQAAIWKKYG
jgi:DNA polymerase-3 subunit epsilon